MPLTDFAEVPILSLKPLSTPRMAARYAMDFGRNLDKAFRECGFVYLTDLPLAFKHRDIHEICDDFFSLPTDEKMKLAKQSFIINNPNTFRGYTPPQTAAGIPKELFDLGSPYDKGGSCDEIDPQLSVKEPNVFPQSPISIKHRSEFMHCEMNVLSIKPLKLLGIGLGQTPYFFTNYAPCSLSTLRLEYSPPIRPGDPVAADELHGTAHTDAGLLTFLFQNEVSDVEIRNSEGKWITAPYIKDSVLVNVGDLLEKISGGQFVSAVHRVRSGLGDESYEEEEQGRYSVLFSFQPGLDCVMKTVEGEKIVYGQYLASNIEGWTPFQDPAIEASATDLLEDAASRVRMSATPLPIR